MRDLNLTAAARRENAFALARATTGDLESAGMALDLAILVSSNGTHLNDAFFVDCLISLLRRTVERVDAGEFGHGRPYAAEIIVGDARPRTDARHVFVNVSEMEMTITSAPNAAPRFAVSVPQLFLLIAACYACGVSLQTALGERLPYHAADPFVLRFADLGVDGDALGEEFELGPAYLAGAGAIGNGFLWALRTLKPRGTLHIVDDDTVSAGNLNRQVWFDSIDVGLPKAVQLAVHAQPTMPNLVLVPRVARLQELPDRIAPTWLRQLIVGVDSARARRSLQSELPYSVFDASTTDITQVTVHTNAVHNRGACLACIYPADVVEEQRELHIAETLGVSVEMVRTERISGEASALIVARYPDLTAATVTDVAYDTLFKQLCAAGTLRAGTPQAAVAPFAFVSALAGALLVVAVVRQLNPRARTSASWNYWRVSPWHPPMLRNQDFRAPSPICPHCSQPAVHAAIARTWGHTSA